MQVGIFIKIYSNQYITSINFFAKTSDKSLSDDILKMEQKSLAKVYDIGYDVFTQKHFMVQQYIEGNTSEDFLNDEFIGGRSVHGIAFLKIFIQILDALSYMHSFGIYCGDVQPKNIVVTKKDVVTNEHRCYLVDFSESGYFGQIPPEKTVILSKYRVPKNSFDARSDIYQAGILLDELLSRMGNLLPWNLADDFMRFKRKMFDVVSKAAAKNPDYRYSSVEEFKKDRC